MYEKILFGSFLFISGLAAVQWVLHIFSCPDLLIPSNICQTIKAKIGLMAFIAIVLGGFLVHNAIKNKKENGVQSEITIFFRSIGVYMPEEKKAQSVLFGAAVAFIYYHLLFGNQAGDTTTLFNIIMKGFTAILLAPLVEEIVYRGILILGLFNFSRYLIKEYMDLDENNFPSFFKGLPIFLLLFSSVSFASDHTNPKTVVLGIIYGVLFLSRRNILMPWAAHTTHNLIAFVYEYFI